MEQTARLVDERDGCKQLLKGHLFTNKHLESAYANPTCGIASVGAEKYLQLYAPCPTAAIPPASVVVASVVMMPATDAILMTRDGMYCVALFSRRGTSLS